MSTQSITVQGDDNFVPIVGLSGGLALPIVKLSQKASQGAEPGLFFRTDTLEAWASINGLVQSRAPNRALFSSTYSATAKPLCRSDDNRCPRKSGTTIYLYKGKVVSPDEIPSETPAKYLETVVTPAACAECPLSKWGEQNAKGKSTPPPCGDSVTWAFILDNSEPVVMRFSGMALRASNQLSKWANIAYVRKQQVYVQLESEAHPSDSGDYYVPIVTALENPLPEVVALARDYAGINLAYQSVVAQASADEGMTFTVEVEGRQIASPATTSEPTDDDRDILSNEPSAAPAISTPTIVPYPMTLSQAQNKFWGLWYGKQRSNSDGLAYVAKHGDFYAALSVLQAENPVPTASLSDPPATPVPHWIDNAAMRKLFWATAKGMGYLTDIAVHDVFKVLHMKEYKGTMDEAIGELTRDAVKTQAVDEMYPD